MGEGPRVQSYATLPLMCCWCAPVGGDGDGVCLWVKVRVRARVRVRVRARVRVRVRVRARVRGRVRARVRGRVRVRDGPVQEPEC